MSTTGRLGQQGSRLRVRWALAPVAAVVLALVGGGAPVSAQSGNVTFIVQVVDANGALVPTPVLSGYQFCLRPGGALPGPQCSGAAFAGAVLTPPTGATGTTAVSVPLGDYALLNGTTGAEVVRFLINGVAVNTLTISAGANLTITAVVRQGDLLSGNVTFQVVVTGPDGGVNTTTDLSGFQFCIVVRSANASQCLPPNVLTPPTSATGATTLTVPRGTYTVLARPAAASRLAPSR